MVQVIILGFQNIVMTAKERHELVVQNIKTAECCVVDPVVLEIADQDVEQTQKGFQKQSLVHIATVLQLEINELSVPLSESEKTISDLDIKKAKAVELIEVIKAYQIEKRSELSGITEEESKGKSGSEEESEEE